VIFLDVFPTGPIGANCTLLGDDEGGHLVIIDPGDEAEMILERVGISGLEVSAILHTHGHMDHAGATAELSRLLPSGVPIGLNREDLPLFSSLSSQGELFGLSVEDPPKPDLELRDGDIIEVGRLKLEVLHTPGHSPGSVCFFLRRTDSGDLLIAGDVLFAGSIGRTDLWGGSFEILEDSIRTRLYTLPGKTRVICGHGPETTIERERMTNPFVRGV